VDRDGLIIGVAAVLFGITALMLIVGIVVNPFFLVVAIPFAGSGYLLWYEASGQLSERISREAGAGDDPRERARRTRRNRRRARASREPNRPTPSPSEARRILEVDDSAGEDDIKAAYRRKAKEHHPDTDSGDEETFKKVSRAYEALSE